MTWPISIYTPHAVDVKQRKLSIFYNKRANANVPITYRNIEKKHIVFNSDNLEIEQDRKRQYRLLVRVLKTPPPPGFKTKCTLRHGSECKVLRNSDQYLNEDYPEKVKKGH